MKINIISKKTFIILSVFLSLFMIFLIVPASISAQTLIYYDDFNDNIINNDWNVSGYTHETLGSHGPYSQLNISEEDGQLNIFGYDVVSDKYINGKIAGWFGKSIVSKNTYSSDTDYSFQTDVEITDALLGYTVELFIEINENNRIVLSMGNHKYNNQLYWPKGTQLLFDEKGIIRCVNDTLENENRSGCITNDFNFDLNKTYNLEIRINPSTKHVYGLIDGNIIHMGTFQGELYNFHVGLAATVRYQGDYINSRFDNFKIYSNTSETILKVSDLKQFSSPWGTQEYDSAINWYPQNPTISRWGCALTSASMILKYYGHDINPDALNEWLKAQKDGFTRNGGIIWTAITRLTELRNNGNRDWPILEFSYLNYAENTLKNEINNNRPGILKLTRPIYDNEGKITSYASHFIVGKGYDDNNIFINDPGKDNHSTLSQANLYWGSTSQLGRFKKSETDLSYIVLYVDDGFDIEVSSDSGKIVGDEYYFKEAPITDPDDPNFESGVETLNAFYYPKPESGNYTINVKGDGVYRLDYYIYDEKGNAITGNSFGAVKENDEDIYTIYFDKIDNENSSVPDITYESALSFWEEAYEDGFTINHGLYTSVKNLMQNSFKNLNRNKEASKSLLEEILYILESYSSESADNQLIIYFKFQVEVLISSL